jgi:hypothetical protein
MFHLAGLAFALGLMGQTTQETGCDVRPAACRVVTPFELHYGDKTFPIAPEGARAWIQENRLTIFPGEAVVLKIGTEGDLSVDSVARASDILSDEDVAKVSAMFEPGGEAEHATEDDYGLSHNAPPMAAPPPNRLRVIFRQKKGADAMVLIIQSGFDNPVNYTAGMLIPARDGQVWQATSVCTIMPGVMGLEHWPSPMLALSLGDFVLEPRSPNAQPRCA